MWTEPMPKPNTHWEQWVKEMPPFFFYVLKPFARAEPETGDERRCPGGFGANSGPAEGAPARAPLTPGARGQTLGNKRYIAFGNGDIAAEIL